ncbi:MAG: amidohydrolase family protein [Lentisphaerae bacterium]|nr:amidohydrolase family protein [Lentisphaerota bacterium]MCP4102277.1 amidohydrolase family protein [Lentisphaerota bacterium]
MQKNTVIKNVSFYDSTEKEFKHNYNILIKNSKIDKISKHKLDINGGYQLIDGSDKYLIPGLINMHSHPQRRHLGRICSSGPFRFGAAGIEDLPDTFRMAYAIKNCWRETINEGVTTIRAAGSKNFLNIELRDIFRQKIITGPRIISTGPIISTTGGHVTIGINGAMEADGIEGVQKTVRQVLKHEADWIKLCVTGGLSGIHKGEHPSMVQFTFEEVAAAVDEAHRKLKKVMVHCMASDAARMAIKAGIDCLEHGNLLSEEIISMMKENNVSFVPTMSGIYKVYQREFDAGNTELADKIKEVVFPQKQVVSKAIKAGILIGAGTDTLGNMIDEIKMLADCGMTNAEALNAAGVNAAKILDIEAIIGSIEESKNADLVLLSADPLADLNNLSKIEKVILSGEFFDSEHDKLFEGI